MKREPKKLKRGEEEGEMTRRRGGKRKRRVTTDASGKGGSGEVWAREGMRV